MVLGFFKFLLRMVGLGLLFKRPLRLFHQEINNIREEFNKRLAKFMLRCILWLNIISLLIIGVVFGLLSLALYLNEIFYSGYKGFLMVSGGCVLLSLLVLLLVNMRGTSHKNGDND